jgi:hypothetical protein
MAYVYRHIRLDINQPFYIGIGKDDQNGSFPRAYSMKGKNSHWNGIVAKTDYRVDIIINDVTWDEAKEKEIEFIALYGRKDKKKGPLCNQTDGGDGVIGGIMKEETKKKISDFQLSLNKKGKPGRKWTEESKRKLSKTNTGFKHTEESKIKMRIPKSEEHKEKLSLLKKGKPGVKAKRNTCEYCKKDVAVNIFVLFHGNKCLKKPGNEDLKRGPQKIQCPHCNTMGHPGAMKLWHFEKCKQIKKNQ